MMGNPEETFQPKNTPSKAPGTTISVKESKSIRTNDIQRHVRSDADEHCSIIIATNGDADSLILDFSSKSLSCLPSCLLSDSLSLSHIVQLSIEYNDICSIPVGLGKQLPNLQLFLADGNKLSEIPEDIGDLASLQEISVCENKIVRLPESLHKLKELRILKVSANSLRQLHSEIGQNCALEEIHVDENKLKRLPSTLGLLKKLHTLNANDNKIEQLISTIGQCECLSVVDLARNKLNQLPESFGTLTKLSRLDLSENKIGSMCEQFSSCDSLETLFLDLNVFPKFPPWFSKLTKVREISMKTNDLAGSAIPEGFGLNCPNLEVLDLRGNFIEELPDSFGFLASLKVCLLGTPLSYLERSPNFQNGNWLTRLPESLSKLVSLTRLCIEENQVLALPKHIGNLVCLQDLYLGSNMIDELPRSFTKLAFLKRCQLSKNRLKRLPEDIGVLTTLTELYLDHNMLRSLPQSMCKLVNLEVFDLTENKLKDVPTDILAGMSQLKALNMFFNKFEVPYSEIPYIVKRTHHAERNPEFKNTWRGRNNAALKEPTDFVYDDLPDKVNDDPDSSGDDIADDDDVDSSADEDWDAQIAASSSASSELTNYMSQVALNEDDEDWDSEAKYARQLSSDKEEGQFDLDDEDDTMATRPILPSPVRFDPFGNSSRPIDYAVQHHRQTPYIYHAESVSRHLYIPDPWIQGQFDDSECNDDSIVSPCS